MVVGTVVAAAAADDGDADDNAVDIADNNFPDVDQMVASADEVDDEQAANRNARRVLNCDDL